MNSTTPGITRGQFLKSAGLLSAGAFAFPYVSRGQTSGPDGDKLRIACCGVGGRGKAAVTALAGETFAAFCDVDEERAADTFKQYPDVPRFKDFRRMFDKMADQIDAVTVSTPDHMHFPIAMAALAHGKHVFVEKPLTHTVAEARKLAATAREKKVATQMGNQGHASDGIRTLKEWIDGGVLGDVTEVHSWTDRPGKVWPQGGFGLPDHSKFIPVVPPTLDWQAWLGVAQDRPYDPAYMPFKWRGFWDFGTGALGDMGCHLLDGAHWVLKLDAPTHIEAVSALHTNVTGPSASMITFTFPARGSLAPMKLHWYDGGLMPPPPRDLETGRELPRKDGGTLFIGTKATVLATIYNRDVRIIPESKMQEMAPSLPPKTIPRIDGGHFAEWVRACKGGPAAGSNFDVSSRLAELCLLSNVAVRAVRPLEWDSAAMRVTNFPEANKYLSESFRPGYGV